MSIRLIALDLDGTLLDSKKQLPEQNRTAIEQCISKGIDIVPCTGRTVIGIPETIRGISGIRYAITVNGGMIEDMKEHTVLDSHLMQKETALKLISQVADLPVMYDIYVNGQGISEERFYNHLDQFKISPEIQKLIKKTRLTVPSITQYIMNLKGSVDKVNMFFADLDLRETVKMRLKQRDDVLVSSSLYNNLEFNAPGASKGSALLRLASHLGLSPEETMACGDGENDFSMIQSAGIGVVMENGMADLKAAADYVTGSNDEAGVAQAIKKLVLSGVE